MNRSAAVVLRVLVLLTGIAAIAFLLWEPHVEGRNANATLFEIYFRDPFLAYVYVGSTPLFIGLYRAFQLLGVAARNEALTPDAVRSVRTIKRCAIALIIAVAIGEIFILLMESDDRAGGVAIGLLIAFASLVVAVAMTLLQPALQKAVQTNPRT